MGDPTDYKILLAGAAAKGATSSLVKSFIDQVVTPYLRGVLSKRAEKTVKANLSKYLKYIESKTRVISSVARSLPFPFEEVYEPLTVQADGFSLEVDSYPRKLFEYSRCVAVTDEAGMGKSTLAKYILRCAIAERKNIPLLVELRRLRAGATLLESICEELLGKFGEADNLDEIKNLFSRGNFIFIFDGFDEVEEGLRPGLVKEINHLAAQFSFCYFLLSSRPEYSVSLFPEFAQVGIRKLTKSQADSLIKRYDAGRGLAKLLIPKVSQVGVQDFLGNPLLVTLLYRAFDHRNSVPPKRTSFFKQVYEALFQDHDLSKGDAYARKKESGLDREDFHKLIRAIGFETFKAGRVSYGSTEIADHIVNAMKRTEFSVDVKKVLDDLLKAVPLFIRDGTEIKWCHKAFQEYFASQYIHCDLSDSRDTAIRRMYVSQEFQKYTEIFRFLGECDVVRLRDVCIEPLLSEVNESCSNDVPLELGCIFDAVDIYYVGSLGGKVEFSDIEARIEKRLKIDLSSKLTSATVNLDLAIATVGVLKERGGRYVLLPSMDSSNFGSFARKNMANLMKDWHHEFGKKIFHVNPTLDDLVKVASKLGSVAHVELAANLPLASRDKFEQIRKSRLERQEAIGALALDAF
jgi:hypothetical protein